MKHSHSKKLLSLTLAVFPLFVGSAVNAANLGQAKSQGWVCEQNNGYLKVAKPNAPADVKALVNSINGKRRSEYARIAGKNKVSPDQVGQLTAQKVIGAAPQYRCR